MGIPTPSSKKITHLLNRWREGDDEAMHQLMPLVYQELYRRAEHYLGKERKNHTISTTALVNEAYLQIVDERDRHLENRAHFFAMAARMMRNYLMQYANARKAQKRGGGDLVMLPREVLELFPDRSTEYLTSLNEAIEHLGKRDKRKAWIFDMRYFAGMTIEEIVKAVDLSRATVKRELQFSRAWLRKFLKEP